MKFFTLFILLINLSIASDKIVLIPGAASSGVGIALKMVSPILGSINAKEYFKHIRQELNKLGFKTIYCIKIEDNDSRSLRSRANECYKNLLVYMIKNPDTKFHLLGHSMGGIIARKVYNKTGMKHKIKSITTISTPHRGAVIASYALRLEKKNNPISLLLKKFEFTSSHKKYLRELDDLLYKKDLQMSDQDSKITYSVSNFKNNIYNTPFEISSKVLSHEIKKRHKDRSHINDGIIERDSMVFGTHLGEIEADHMESGCVLYTYLSKGCKESLEIIIDHFKEIIK